MVDLEQYDIALAKHHDTVIQLRLHFVLGFPPQLFIKKHFVDCTVGVIAKTSRWRAGFQKTS
jgi:hypothetical protein